MDEAELVLESVRIINFNPVSTDVKVMKFVDEGDTIPGSSNNFFWGTEYASDIYESDAVTIDSAQTEYGFIARLITNETSGVSTISYKFVDANNADDFVMITVGFNAETSGINEGIDLAGISMLILILQ